MNNAIDVLKNAIYVAEQRVLEFEEVIKDTIAERDRHLRIQNSWLEKITEYQIAIDVLNNPTPEVASGGGSGGFGISHETKYTGPWYDQPDDMSSSYRPSDPELDI